MRTHLLLNSLKEGEKIVVSVDFLTAEKCRLCDGTHHDGHAKLRFTDGLNAGYLCVKESPEEIYAMMTGYQ